MLNYACEAGEAGKGWRRLYSCFMVGTLAKTRAIRWGQL